MDDTVRPEHVNPPILADRTDPDAGFRAVVDYLRKTQGKDNRGRKHTALVASRAALCRLVQVTYDIGGIRRQGSSDELALAYLVHTRAFFGIGVAYRQTELGAEFAALLASSLCGESVLLVRDDGSAETVRWRG